jgi:hypothetical protein
MQKPAKTFADYVVVAISPVLIMVLVGSLAFFLIQVFYRGELVHGIRWLMFWFVLGIVLVSRIGIEQSKGHARFYGAALALATWLYLTWLQAAPVLGIVLLAITWWCAHKLTTDCTLINEDEDASGEGVLQGLWRTLEFSVEPPTPLPPPLPSPQRQPTTLDLLAAANLADRLKRRPPRAPGRWVIYFSLAALPLFGIGQLLLPADDAAARRTGFAFLAVYLSAALSLLVTTSFLGLRRYLRQRFVEMPASIAFGWIRFGVFLAVGVLALALALPRPGANNTLKNLTYRVDHKTHKASDYALPFNPPGEGEGTPGDQPNDRDQPGVDSKNAPPGNGTQTPRNTGQNQSTARDQPTERNPSDGGAQAGGSQSGQGAQADDRGQTGERPPTGAPGAAGNKGPSGDSDQASDRSQPGGSGEAREPEGNGTDRPPGNGSPSGKNSQRTESREHERKPAASKPVDRPEKEQPENTTPGPKPPSTILHRLLRVLLIVALAALLVWLIIRYRQVIRQTIRSFIAAVREFFRKLFSWRGRRSAAVTDMPSPAPVLEPFAAYENPFVTGKAGTWPAERLLRYTYEAVQAWAQEQGIKIAAQQTPREFCVRLSEHFPDFGPELERFSFFYGHAAFAEQLPDDFETESIRRLWQDLGDSVMVVASR